MGFSWIALLVVVIATLPAISKYLVGPVIPISCSPADSLIVVTGVSSGLGQHAALTLAQKGFHVLGTVRKAADSEKVLQLSVRDEWKGKGSLLTTICDVRNPQDVKSLGKYVRGLTQPSRTSAQVGKKPLHLLGLVNNAGIRNLNFY